MYKAKKEEAQIQCFIKDLRLVNFFEDTLCELTRYRIEYIFSKTEKSNSVMKILL
jgi:hypothetical protein